jgi:hypothetical protein
MRGEQSAVAGGGRDVHPFFPNRDESIEPFLRAALARPEEELERERLRAEFWNWRCRCGQMRRDGMRPPPGQTYEETIARAARSALSDGLIDAVVRGDVSYGGVPLRDLSPRAFAWAADSAQERHHALNWVCGFAADWDRVPTDT